MNRKKCEACPHICYDGSSYRCGLIVGDVLTGTAKACSLIRAAECKAALADYEAGKYKSVIDEEAQDTAAEIIKKAQARYAAEKKSKVCKTCKHYPENPVKNPAKMENCEVFKIAVRGDGKACPQWEEK